MFGIGSNKRDQVCGFVIVDTEEIQEKSEYQKYCINKLESIINSFDISIGEDRTILDNEITINEFKNKDKNRVYIPVEYSSEKDSVENRKEFRDQLSSKEGVSVVYNKKASIK